MNLPREGRGGKSLVLSMVFLFPFFCFALSDCVVWICWRLGKYHNDLGELTRTRCLEWLNKHHPTMMYHPHASLSFA